MADDSELFTNIKLTKKTHTQKNGTIYLTKKKRSTTSGHRTKEQTHTRKMKSKRKEACCKVKKWYITIVALAHLTEVNTTAHTHPNHIQIHQ